MEINVVFIIAIDRLKKVIQTVTEEVTNSRAIALSISIKPNKISKKIFKIEKIYRNYVRPHHGFLK